MGQEQSHSQLSENPKKVRVYKNNVQNRRLGRVGKPIPPRKKSARRKPAGGESKQTTRPKSPGKKSTGGGGETKKVTPKPFSPKKETSGGGSKSGAELSVETLFQGQPPIFQRLGFTRKPTAKAFKTKLAEFKDQTPFSNISGGFSSQKLGNIEFFEKCLGEKLSEYELKTIRDIFVKNKTYKGLSRLGKPGKDGVAVRVNCGGNVYALKFFVPGKSHKKILAEGLMQQMAAREGIAPKVYAIKLPLDKTHYPYIAMEIVNGELLKDKFGKGTLDSKVQKQILELFILLDSVGVLHNDGNPLNLMWDETKHKPILIDYGFSRLFDLPAIKKRGPDPNLDTTLYAMLLSFRHYGISAPMLKKFVDDYHGRLPRKKRKKKTP